MRQAQIQMSRTVRVRVRNLGLVAFSFAAVLSLVVLDAPAWAQLPPVNMGRWVHQPGDNQYSNETQQSRHGGGPAPVQAAPVNVPLAMPGWRPTPKPRRSDISLLPIVCDEPVPPPGFPPMPDQLDLPGLRGGGMLRSSGGGGGGGGSFSSSYGGSGGGSVSIGAPAAGMGEVTRSQGYTSVPPGAFVQKKTPYGRGNSTGAGGGGDVYASGDGGGAPRSSAAQNALRKMGKEPGLNDKGYAAQPEAPTAMQVNQAATQDLSLPDDEMQSASSNKRTNSQGSKIFNRTVGRIGNRMINSINAMPLPIKMPGGR